MGARSNALSELTRFWLQSRHGCLVTEAVPVKVYRAYSDIDFVAMRPDLQTWTLPDGTSVKRAIIEAKGEHDFDPKGQDFGRRLRDDVTALGESLYIPSNKNARFSMLRQEHYETAANLFGTTDFHRLLVVHALDEETREQICPLLAGKGIHCLTVRDIMDDLMAWYEQLAHPSTIRNTLIGDLWHLLIGYGNLRPTTRQEATE